MLKVVHCKSSEFLNAPDDEKVYIGRGSIWGNPFRVGVEAENRRTAIEMYRKYIMNRPDLLALLGNLRGKMLGCFCHPKPCHGNVLAELVRERFSEDEKIFKNATGN